MNDNQTMSIYMDMEQPTIVIALTQLSTTIDITWMGYKV